MQTPTQIELQHWLTHEYDPRKAHEYYERTKKLKGRNKRLQAKLHKRPQAKAVRPRSKLTAAQQKAWIQKHTVAIPQKTPKPIKLDKQKAAEQAKLEKQRAVKAKQHKEITAQIQGLEDKLKKLEALIDTKLREEASESRKALFSARTAATEAAKPPTAAEKSQAARESAQYRDQNQQKIKTAAAKASAAVKSTPTPSVSLPASSGESTRGKGFLAPSSSLASKTVTSKKAQDVESLKTLATKVKGEITVAKQKLAAL